MAAEAAQAEVPSPPPPQPPPTAPGASPEKRVLPVPGEGGDEDEPPPDRKRRRACVAALEGVACAAAAASSGPRSGCDADSDSASFSFPHARGGFVVAMETTPKFGSFNPPPAAVEQAADLSVTTPASLDGDGSPDEQVPAASSASGAEDDGGKEGEKNSQSPSMVDVEAGCGQAHTVNRNDDLVLTVDQP